MSFEIQFVFESREVVHVQQVTKNRTKRKRCLPAVTLDAAVPFTRLPTVLLDDEISVRLTTGFSAFCLETKKESVGYL